MLLDAGVSGLLSVFTRPSVKNYRKSACRDIQGQDIDRCTGAAGQRAPGEGPEKGGGRVPGWSPGYPKPR